MRLRSHQGDATICDICGYDLSAHVASRSGSQLTDSTCCPECGGLLSGLRTPVRTMSSTWWLFGLIPGLIWAVCDALALDMHEVMLLSTCVAPVIALVFLAAMIRAAWVVEDTQHTWPGFTIVHGTALFAANLSVMLVGSRSMRALAEMLAA